ncbi:MAG: hypothetical protein JRG71_11315 [Deltaproteobacteria bacterium]|nr:hypothetical protein [Deltaproteobacteria bacterium]
MKIINKPPSEKSQRILESLTRAVAQELDKKKRLGHYAVICENGKPIFIGENQPTKN